MQEFVKVVSLLNDNGDNAAYPSTICPHSLLSGPVLQASSKTMVYNYSEWCLGVLAGPDNSTVDTIKLLPYF